MSCRLYVHLRVPITVKEDGGIGRIQIYPLSSCPGRQTEDKMFGLGLVEHVDIDFSHDAVGRAVEATVLVTSHVQIVAE